MIFALVAVIVLQLAVLVLAGHRFLSALERVEERHAEDRAQLLDRIQAPQAATAQSLTNRVADVDLSQPVYVSPFDDEQWQTYEAEKQNLQESTQELIDTFLGDQPFEAPVD